MLQSTNYNFNKPEANDVFSLDHWNENTDKIDSLLVPEFEDYTSTEVEVPDAPTSLSNIKSNSKIADLFQNIKAFLKNALTRDMIVNNCTTEDATVPLSANQGKVLQDQVTTLNTKFDNLGDLDLGDGFATQASVDDLAARTTTLEEIVGVQDTDGTTLTDRVAALEQVADALAEI